MRSSLSSKGFGLTGILAVLLVLALLASASVYVYHKNHKPKARTVNDSSSGNSKQAKTDPYAGWKTYTNAQYGFSYKYPSNWTTADEGATSPSQSATKQEFSTGLKLTTNTKYNNTVDVEVLNEDMATAVAWYDGYYAQSSLNHVTKTTNSLKGKQSTQYDVTNSDSSSKLYLFSVESKTYLFSSVNEKLNLQASPEYWTTFSKVFDSMQISQ